MGNVSFASLGLRAYGFVRDDSKSGFVGESSARNCSRTGAARPQVGSAATADARAWGATATTGARIDGQHDGRCAHCAAPATAAAAQAICRAAECRRLREFATSADPHEETVGPAASSSRDRRR